MIKRIPYYWRMIATAFSFSVFGMGGITLRILIFPLLNVFIWRVPTRIYCSRLLIRYSFRAFIEMMRILRVLTYDTQGLERLQRTGLLILANHPTLIDTVFLMAFVKQADCIVKNSLWQNPFTCGPIRAAGYICNQNDPDLLKNCESALARGSNLLIFPEGTRTPRTGQLNFKRGAANIAIRYCRDVTPVVIQCTPATLSKREKWWQIPASTPHFTLHVGQDIVVKSSSMQATNEILATRRLTLDLQHYFSERLA